MFNSLHSLAPCCYLSTVCQPVTDNPGCRYRLSDATIEAVVASAIRSLRYVNCVRCVAYLACGVLDGIKSRTTSYGPRSFAVAGPSTWNSLPAPPRNCQVPSSFRHELKQSYLPEHIFSTLVTVCNCKSGRTLAPSIHHHYHHMHIFWLSVSGYRRCERPSYDTCLKMKSCGVANTRAASHETTIISFGLQVRCSGWQIAR